MKIKKLRISPIFAFVLAFFLPFFMGSCKSSTSSEPFIISSYQIEGTFDVGTPMTAANVFVVNYTGGSGTATVKAGVRNGISVPERQVSLSGSGTLRIELSGTPTAIGTHTLFLEVIVAGVTHTISDTFDVTQAGVVQEPVVFTINHETEFELGNARMIPFALAPRSNATVTVVNPTGMWVSITHNRFAGTGVITLTPRTNFAGGTFEVRATYPGMSATTETLTLTAAERVTGGKKGVAMGMNVARGNITDNLYKLRPHWFWTWGVGLTPEQMALIPEGIEHVPTFWHPRYMTASNIARVNELFEQGHIRYVRGFNEPDLADQANMTVEAALDSWAVLSRDLHPGIRLISPAESHPRTGENSWMSRFMRGVEERGLRVDYIAVHIYIYGIWANQIPATQVPRQIGEVYQRWGRRVWLMETGVRYTNAGSIHANNNFTQAQIVQYMRDLLPQLEAIPELHRYSWFEPAPSHARLYRGRLIECPIVGTYDPFTTCDTGVLSIVGQFYSDWMPNTNIVRR